MSDRVSRVPAPVFPGISDSVRVAAGDLLFLSGVVGSEPGGGRPSDFRRGVELVFEELGRALARGGAAYKDVVRFNVYIVGITPEKVATYREVRDRFVDPEHVPASTLVGVAALVSDAFEIEIDAIAAV